MAVVLPTILLMIIPLSAFGQKEKPVIDEVDLQSSPAASAKKLTFHLVLLGESFGRDRKKINITLTPAAGISKSPTVKEIRRKGSVIYAEFVASKDYEIEKIQVSVNGVASEEFDFAAFSQEQSTLSIEAEKKKPAPPGPLKKYIHVYRTLIDPQVVSDTFGKRIAKRFLVYQVTVTNRNRDFQFLIHDISVTFPKGLLGLDPEFELSSTELSMLRGVAERGQAGGRNLAIRILRGIGSVAASLSGITTFNAFFSPSVAAWSGPTMNAATDIFPDFSINQMHRLNDSAYIVNSLVPKQQARVIAIFVPQRIFLDAKQRDTFWEEPTQLWKEEFELRNLEIVVDGDFITEVSQVPASVTTVVVDETEKKKLQDNKPEVHGVIVGQFLLGSELALSGNVPGNMTIEITGTPTDTRMEFLLKADQPVPPDTVVQIELKKKDMSTQANLSLRYTAEPLSLDAPATTIELTQGQKDFEVELTGNNFIPGVTLVRVSGKGVKISDTTVESPTKLKVKLSADAAAVEGDRDLFVINSSGGAPSQAITIKVKK